MEISNLFSQDNLLYILLPTLAVLIYHVKLGPSRVSLNLILFAYLLFYGFSYGFFQVALIACIAITAVTIIIVLINLIMDPLGVYFLFHKKGFNSYKTDGFRHMGSAKAYRLSLLKPDLIILGSSRAAIGIDPSHKALKKYKNAYNSSIFSVTIEDLFSYLKFAQSIQPLKTVIIGLEFYTFNTHFRRNSDDIYSKDEKYDQYSLSSPEKANRFRSKINLIKDTLTSLEVFKFSRKSFKNRKRGYPLYSVNENGLVLWNQVMLKKFGGIKSIFETSNIKFLTTHNEMPKENPFTLESTATNKTKLESLSELIAFAKENNIDLKLYISPNHANQMQLVRTLGLAEFQKEWKRKLVEIIAESNYSNISLCDFSGFNGVTTEKIPDDNETIMKYFIDSSHFNTASGDMVLNKLFDFEKDSVPEDFGVFLTKENIEEYISDMEVKAKEYADSHKEIVIELEKLVKSFNEGNKN